MARERALLMRRAKCLATCTALIAMPCLAVDHASDGGADRAPRSAAKECGDDRAGERPLRLPRPVDQVVVQVLPFEPFRTGAMAGPRLARGRVVVFRRCPLFARLPEARRPQ